VTCFYGKDVESGRVKLKLPTLHTSSERSTKLSQSQSWFEKEVRTEPATSSISPRADRRHLTQNLLASLLWKTKTNSCARRFLCLIFIFVSSIVGFAQQHEHEPRATPSVKLGKISFPTSCSSQAQSEVETGVASLHSFEYDNAMRHFEKVLQHDPTCSIAYWGEAMSLYHQLWNVPSKKDLAEGWQFVEKARAGGKTSRREQDYVEAMEIFYKPGKQSAVERAEAYSKRMERLHEDYPSDEEAAVFYALSLLAAEPPNDTSLQYTKKSGGTSEWRV